MPAHSWAPRLGTEVSQLRACHLSSEHRCLNPSFLPVYLMVLSQHKAMLYLLNYQISAQKMTAQLRSVSQEQSLADTCRDSRGESGTPIPMCPAAISVLCHRNSSSSHQDTKPHIPTRAGRAGAAATDVPMVTGAAWECFARHEGERLLPRSWATAESWFGPPGMSPASCRSFCHVPNRTQPRGSLKTVLLPPEGMAHSDLAQPHMC